ncbi:SRPBCC family protein [Sediminibacterium sp.]|uniref:SRPBCC family protein n=1 Tax=Sediminibacterium sp. TaxID=1917865 RepID=UPI00271F100A|nr:SRPBCC family protein [Sediminibacterium sp.]MDO9000375.1 SRPBCC family protein [Bacteroidota bacterium]MDP3147056.1 SRPBCC family protein [Bacteroidota bacterium]MDP3567408.1 SRPBCC family protein [Sediminibacterium sp.]
MLHTIQTKQFIKSDINTLWEFISSPKNLSKITPKYMGFNILSDLGDGKMFPGQIIEYFVTPIAGIKMNWVTEITHVKDKEYFVDEQRFGPYSMWHHKHFLKEVSGGVEMIDVVHYKVPFGVFGKLANSLFIKKQLSTIFDFRYKKMEELFNQ